MAKQIYNFEVFTHKKEELLRIQRGRLRRRRAKIVFFIGVIILILLVLYPTVMLLSRFMGPVLDDAGAPPWLAMWLSQVISVAVLQWALMPWVGQRFRRWLDPIDGAGVRISVFGASVILVGYLVTLSVFAIVRWLQYWDFSRG